MGILLPDAIDRLEKRIEALQARCAMLQAKLWSVLKDRRDNTCIAALTAKQDLEWAIAHGLNSHLPTLEEVQADGPYVRVGWDETLEQACERAARDLQKPTSE